MKRLRTLMLCGLAVLGAGCGVVNRLLTDDPFYYSLGEWDSIRLPLIEPYEATNALDGAGWEIGLPFERTSELEHQAIRYVESLAVQNGVVMVTARGAWFGLIPAAHIQRTFNSRAELYAYVSEYGVKEPQWGTPDELYAQFRDTGCLDWMAECGWTWRLAP